MKRFQHILTIIAVLTALLCCLSVTAFAADTVQSGTLNDSISWTLDSDGVLTVSGQGAIPAFSKPDIYTITTPWFPYKDQIFHVVVEEGITEIGQYAFAYLDKAETITLPESTENVRVYAFLDCTSLTEFTFPENVKEFYGDAFLHCNSLKRLTMPKVRCTIKFLPTQWFPAIEEIIFPGDSPIIDSSDPFRAGTPTIYYPADNFSWENFNFKRVSNYFRGQWVAVPSDLPSDNHDPSLIAYGNAVQMQWKLDRSGTLTINGTRGVEEYFDEQYIPWLEYSHLIKTIVIEDGITSLSPAIFKECNSLNSIHIPPSVKKFTGSGLYEFSTKGIDIHITDLAAWCGLEYEYGLNFFHSFAYTGPNRLYLNGTLLEHVIIPDDITAISAGAFGGTSIQSVTIPTSVDTIGRNAFAMCPNLKSVYISDMEQWITKAFAKSYIYTDAHNGVEIINEYMSNNPGYTLYINGENAKSIVIPPSVTEIGDYTFALCANVESVTFPSNITHIGKGVFYGCRKLSNLVIPESVVYVDTKAFANMNGLKRITFTGDAPLFAEDCFAQTITNAYYPTDVTSWTNDVRQNYGGNVYWNPIQNHYTHTFGPWAVAKKATCEIEGEQQRYCSFCGYHESEILPVTGHQWDNGIVTKEPTADERGEKCFTCTICHTQKIESIPSLSDNPFTDVNESDWYYAPVMWARANNVTGGTSATTFGPNDGCTRAQVVTFLWAANGKPEPASMDNPFTDVPNDAWYLKPVLWAVEQGITGGVAEGKFGPDQTCTRAQIATFLYAAKGKPAVSGKSPFDDVADTDWFANPVIWAKENEVTGGISATEFGPNQVCTRAQVVTFLYKVYG